MRNFVAETRHVSTRGVIAFADAAREGVGPIIGSVYAGLKDTTTEAVCITRITIETTRR